jgi:hypothetical protein
MPVFEFTCQQCGPFLVISLEDFRRHRHTAPPPPIRCPDCRAPISIDVVYYYDENAKAESE